MSDKELLTVAEAAVVAGVTRSRMYAVIAHGGLVPVIPGKFRGKQLRRSDVEAWRYRSTVPNRPGWTSKAVIRNCEVCGVEVRRYPSWIKSVDNLVFCCSAHALQHARAQRKPP